MRIICAMDFIEPGCAAKAAAQTKSELVHWAKLRHQANIEVV